MKAKNPYRKEMSSKHEKSEPKAERQRETKNKGLERAEEKKFGKKR
jgi:hypothetical protein